MTIYLASTIFMMYNKSLKFGSSYRGMQIKWSNLESYHELSGVCLSHIVPKQHFKLDGPFKNSLSVKRTPINFEL